MIDDILCALACHDPPFLMGTENSELHKATGRVRIETLRELLDAYHKAQCNCGWLFSDNVWSVEGKNFDRHALLSFPTNFPGWPLRRSIHACIHIKPGREASTYTLIFGSQPKEVATGNVTPILFSPKLMPAGSSSDTDVEATPSIPTSKTCEIFFLCPSQLLPYTLSLVVEGNQW